MLATTQEFDQIAQGISNQLYAQGVEIAAFGSTRLMPNLPVEVQHAVVQRVRRQLELMERMRPDFREFEKLSVICQYYNLRPVDDDVFNRLNDDIGWEIVDFNLNQLYRSVRVFECMSYSIEEAEVYSPWELYSRPKPVLDTLVEVTRALAESKKIIDLQWIKPYILVETMTPDKRRLQIQHLFACPLADQTTKKNVAFVSALRWRRLPDDQKVVLLNKS